MARRADAHAARARVGCPVFVLNDARTATLGELTFGHGRDAKTLLYFGLGTGVGGGVVIDGKLRLGPLGAAGELGHRRSSPMARSAAAAIAAASKNPVSASAISARRALLRSGQAPTLHELTRGDPAASPRRRWPPRGARRAVRTAFARAGEWLGIGAANLISALHPEMVVIAAAWRSRAICCSSVRATVRARVGSFPPTRCASRSRSSATRGLLGGIASPCAAAFYFPEPTNPSPPTPVKYTLLRLAKMIDHSLLHRR